MKTQEAECHPQRSLRACRSRRSANAPGSVVLTGSHKPNQDAVLSKRPDSEFDLRPKLPSSKRQTGQNVLVDQWWVLERSWTYRVRLAGIWFLSRYTASFYLTFLVMLFRRVQRHPDQDNGKFANFIARREIGLKLRSERPSFFLHSTCPLNSQLEIQALPYQTPSLKTSSSRDYILLTGESIPKIQ